MDIIYLLKIISVFIAGIFSGFINILAGGGSMLTLPVLIFIGLPAAVANGTNRVALVAGSIAGAVKFKKAGYFELKFSLLMGIPAIIGAIFGSLFAIKMPEKIFKILLVVIILMSGFLTVFSKKNSDIETDINRSNKNKNSLIVLSFLLIGFYGGLIQVGVGFIFMAVLALLIPGSFSQLNSVKNLVIGIYLVFTLIVFIIYGKIDWVYGIVLSAGNALGAWFGTHYTLKAGDKWVKIFILIIVPIMSVKLLFF